ncbi:alkaline phosphatase family protein [Geminocystis herdmanii]|uniref:alkaline phosphatase family protein n=1 Tax=Geminocystis herdmanii TaxID=669359 RepID=UPI000345E317|nr:alkaline phosphatase family protein [Geminocystis herdmanii]
MSNPVIAIGLDSADPILLEKWMAQGHLPNLEKIRSQGSYGRIYNPVNYADQKTKEQFTFTEPLWAIFTTGCLPNKTGYWSPVKYSPDNYKVEYDRINGTYDYQEYKPFYSLLENHHITIFDLPVTGLCKELKGLQVLAWGGHDPFTPRHSQPPELLPELNEKYGEDNIYGNDTGVWWNKKYCQWLPPALKKAISQRSAICQDLLTREPWDLFITVISETHTAGHDLYYTQDNHPLYSIFSKNAHNQDLMLEVFQKADQAIGEILSQVPENAYIIIFSLHGMDVNVTDLFTMFFLPEFLYRFNFNQSAIAHGEIKTTPPVMITNPLRHSWLGEIWVRNHPPNLMQKLFKSLTPSQFLYSAKNGLDCPFSLLKEKDDLVWAPSRWYQPLWHQMKAFALPAFNDGQIRLNLKGRESQGIVDASEYNSVCEEITTQLLQLVDGRTGKPIVKRVIRTRKSPLIDDSKLPDADLIVKWEENPTDVVDSPKYGRIGPVPYFRPGGHRAGGFLMAKGEGIIENSSFGSGNIVDLAPTILKLMDVPIPEYFDGKPLF